MLKETKDLFSDKILHHAIKLFGGSQEQCTDLGGFEAFVYELEIDKKFYILKITHTVRRSVNYIMGELEFVNYLASHGVPSSKAILSINNKLVETIDDNNGGQFLCYLFEKAEGSVSKFEDWSDDFITTWGELAGMMNRLSKDFAPSSEKFLRLQWNQHNYYDFDRHIPPTKMNTIANCKAITQRVQAFSKNKNSFGIVHGDLHQGNFFHNDGILTPFDFDDCEFGYYINDIAMPLYYALPYSYRDNNRGISNEEFGENFLTHFLKGYRKENKFDKEWILKIPDFLQIRSVILFVIFHQYWDEENLSENQKAWIERTRSHIDGEIKLLDIDYSKFC